MKKLYPLFLIFALLSFAACSPKSDAEPSPSPVQSEAVSPSPSPSSEPETPELSEAGEELVGILEMLQSDCHPGTAGSSLIAAELAARLLDWEVENPDCLDQALAAAELFGSRFSGSEGAEFESQLGLVYGQLEGLLGEEAALLLESCGYESSNLPYDEAAATQLFEALYSGLAFEIG